MFRLSDSDIERIDRESMRILGELGVRVDDDGLREAALAAGAKRGRGSDGIVLGEEMVREYVAMAPRRARYADCCGNVTELGPGSEATFWTGAALNYINGRDSRAIHEADLAEFARLADSLDTVFAVTGTNVEEAPPWARDFVGMRILAENTSKHLRPLLFTAEGVKPILEMAQVIADGKSLAEQPLVSFGYSCLSPLHWSKISSDLWRNSRGHKIPVMLNGEPIAGATSPVTLAGSVAMSSAEILAGVVLVQLIEAKRPVVYNLGFAHTTNMRTGTCLSGTAECGLMAHVGGRLAEYYGLPSAAWMDNDSFMDDEQAAIEQVLTGFAHVTAGINVIWGMGQLQTQKAVSPLRLVMDHEIAQALGRYGRGFEINEETLAYEAIREVVEGGADFLSHEHTFRHFRQELGESALMMRTDRDTWVRAGATSLGQRTEARLAELLGQPRDSQLTEQQLRDIRGIEQQELKRRG